MSPCKKLFYCFQRVRDDVDFACMTQSALIQALLRNLQPELWIEYMLPYILQCALSMSTSYATYDMLHGVFLFAEIVSSILIKYLLNNTLNVVGN